MNIDFNKIDNYFFIGIGGMGMSSLASYFIHNKKKVFGYDRNKSNITDSLIDKGANIFFDDSASNIPKYIRNDINKTLVIYTPAIKSENSILNYFLNNKYLVFKRAVVLGLITKNNCLAIAGSHGKSSVTSLLTFLMNQVGINHTAFIGAVSNNIKSNFSFGSNSLFVLEADEFDKSFLNLDPKKICITSIDYDHNDIYANHLELMESFKEFSNKVSGDSLVFRSGLPFKGISYGLEEGAFIIADNIKLLEEYSSFNLLLGIEKIKNVNLPLPNYYNIENLLAAVGMLYVYGVDFEKIKYSLSKLNKFKGIYRRFEYKIKKSKIIFIDDYAHHPTEIISVINNLRYIYPQKKILCVFQPHLFSRTLELMDDFAYALSMFDILILLDIYAARENPIKGVSAHSLLKKVNLSEKTYSSKKDLSSNIKKYKFDIIISMGAGDIEKLVPNIKETILKKN